MSFAWGDVRADVPYADEDLEDIRYQRNGVQKTVGMLLAQYKAGIDERKPYGVRHKQLLRLAIEVGQLTEAEAALELLRVK